MNRIEKAARALAAKMAHIRAKQLERIEKRLRRNRGKGKGGSHEVSSQ